MVRKLRDALGEPICQLVEDPFVVEIMLNPDGRLFVERLGQGIEVLVNLEAGAAEIIIGTVAHALKTHADSDQPIISGNFPSKGIGSKACYHPSFCAKLYNPAPGFPAYCVEAYVRDRIMTSAQSLAIRDGIVHRLNIVICIVGIVGKVRDGAALTILKAWNTGHPGGVTTIHSNSTLSALRRLKLTGGHNELPVGPGHYETP